MVRVQVYLKPDQDRLLEELAKLHQVSKAHLIRESIDLYLERLPLKDDPALQLIGLAGKTGIKDLSERHDDYLRQFASHAPRRNARKRYARNLR